MLVGGLLVACAYAAFAAGAAGLPQETWLQLGLAVLTAFAAVAWLGARAVRPQADPLAIAGLAALVAFAAWTGASLAWSVAPDRTWIELNRGLAYVLVVAVALAAASSTPRAAERLAAGWLVVATAVIVYALAGKVAPGVVDHARIVARLRAPLEYWNALALVCVLAVPPALRFATTRTLREGWRVGALLVLLLALCCLGMTYSRGGFLALAVAVIAVTALGRERIPGLIAFGLAAAAAAPILAIAYTVEGLSDNGAPRDEAVEAGLLLGAALVGCGSLVALAAMLLIRHEHRVTWDARAWAVVGAVAVVGAAGGVTALATSENGLRGTVDKAIDDFTQVRQDPIYDPGRLLTVSSGNRWAWWREASGAFADEPVLGWGAGSFPVARRLYRVSVNDVQQPHSVPLQFLAETGVVGALLALGGLFLLGAAAVRRVAQAAGTEREIGGALVAAAVAWFVHACVDWDWDIPAVTLPMLIFLGVLGARPAGPAPPPMLAGEERAPLGRAFGLLLGGLALCAFTASALLPALSDAKTDEAYRGITDRSAQGLRDAAADADIAARLDPIAVRPLFAAAAVAEGRGRLLEARKHLLEAVERQPYSREAWERLTRVALGLADREGVRRASQRTLALDPGNPAIVSFVRGGQGILSPPEASATATGTPLPSAATPAGAAPTATPPAGASPGTATPKNAGDAVPPADDAPADRPDPGVPGEQP